MYRWNDKGWESPCGSAAYIWLEGAFPNTDRLVYEMHSPMDSVDQEPGCVVEGLLTWSLFIVSAEDMHKSKRCV